MESKQKKVYGRLILQIAAMAIFILLICRFGGIVLAIMLPFLVAFTMAWALNPLIQFLHKKLHLTRKVFSFIIVLVVYALILGVIASFTMQMISQAAGLLRSLPTIVSELQSVYVEVSASLSELLELLPPEYEGLRGEILGMLASAWDWLRTLLSRGISLIVRSTSGIAVEIPSFVIFLTVLVLASCFITADFPNLRENIYQLIGRGGTHSLRMIGHSFRTAVLGYFRSQLIFALIDMAIILIAFFIIGVPYPLPIALALCFLDFIPFFGAGTVLVPWGAACLVLGLSQMGVSLLLLYAVLYVLRRVLEPRILGGATGFSSLQMLFSMYAGMQLAGVTGLVVAPVVWITVVNFLRSGVMNGFFSDMAFVARDLSSRFARPYEPQDDDTAAPAGREEAGTIMDRLNLRILGKQASPKLRRRDNASSKDKP